MKLRFFFLHLLFLLGLSLSAQDFDAWFEDNTLRIDYIFAGDATRQEIYLEQLYKQPRWAGRKARLTESPLRGNGQLVVADKLTGQRLYTTTFSTLFQEWQLDQEAQHVQRAFQCSYNVPFPKRPVTVTVTLTDKHQHTVCQMCHTVDPADILIQPIGENGIPYYYIHKGAFRVESLALRDSTVASLNSKPSTLNKDRDYTATPYDPLAGVDITSNVDLAILAEGYTEQQMGKFYADARRAADALFEREPFASLKDRFNVVAVAAPSPEAGPSVPHKGVWRRGVTSCHYDTFYSQRYLMSQNMHRIYDALSGVPFEHIMVLVNSDTYGGGGIYNQVTFSTSDHPTFKQVFVHEFGHSYAGLADEYAYDDMDTEWYPADTEPWEPNVTTLHDFASKWQDLMPKGQPIPTPLDPRVPDFKTIQKDDTKAMALLNACTQKVGVFEGAGYQSKGCYRPAQECRMKINEVLDFCPVCTRAIRRITEFYTAK
ncbi:MAG: peptidase M64 [Bacteroidaceae bacterium]|nr:peptidase M64 [Bacteroidaceae bacterium]